MLSGDGGMDMHYELECLINNLALDIPEEWELPVTHGLVSRVVLWQPNDQDVGDLPIDPDEATLCSVTATGNESEQVRQEFERLFDDGVLMPRWGGHSEVDFDLTGEDELVQRRQALVDQLPTCYRSEIDKRHDQLLSVAGAVANTVAWRCAATSRPEVVETGFWGKRNSQHKHQVRLYLQGFFGFTPETEPPLHTSPEIRRDVAEFLRSSQQVAPVGHELIREAWDLRVRSARGALVLGVAALEAGVKQFVQELVPDTSWLLENLPSPPMEKILKTYLPSISGRGTGAQPLPPPPSRMTNTPFG